MGYRHFQDMVWPTCDNDFSDIEWTLRYSNPSKKELLFAASVMSAYRQLINDPSHKRDKVVKQVRKGSNHGH